MECRQPQNNTPANISSSKLQTKIYSPLVICSLPSALGTYQPMDHDVSPIVCWDLLVFESCFPPIAT